jgi:hypothetical protein
MTSPNLNKKFCAKYGGMMPAAQKEIVEKSAVMASAPMDQMYQVGFPMMARVPAPRVGEQMSYLVEGNEMH